MAESPSKPPPESTDEEEVLDEATNAWLDLLQKADLSHAELAEMASRAVALKGTAEELAELGPQSDEELYEWFREKIGVEIPRVAVCPGHVAPFDVVCDIHFFRVLRLLLIASRGGAKTSLMGWLDVVAAESFPGFGSWTTGPGMRQGERKYEHILPFVVEGGVIGGKEMPHIARSTVRETIYHNGSKIGIGPGTIAANNGPREPRLHRDEVELMEQPVYKQAGNIPAGRKTPDGRYIPAQVIDTSTMKWAHGFVAKTKEDYEKAIKDGKRPRIEVRIFCLYECAQEVPNCRSAPDDQRKARLKKLGLDPCSLCDCNTYESDVWDEDEKGNQPPRTLEQVCNGRLFRSRGFKPLEDIKTLFLENDRAEWEAEQECSSPSKEGVYIKSYSQVRNGIKNYIPDPNNGDIYMGVDWGGTDAHSVGWYQLLDRPVVVESYMGDKIKALPAGSLVRFHEIYRAGIGDVDLGKMVIATEDQWRKQWPGWRVKERYPDYQNQSSIRNWKDHLNLPMTSRIFKDFDSEVQYIRNWVGKGMFYVVIDKCPMFDRAIRSWREENGHEARDVTSNWATHPMAECRYVIHNLEAIGRKAAVAKRAAPQNQELLANDGEESGVTVRSARRKKKTNIQVVGPVGAEDSPNRPETRRMKNPVAAPTETHLRP